MDNNDNIENNEVVNVTKEDVREIAKRSYLDYSMSVIIDRALPDSRDGLKPVHRRILYAMNQLKIFHNSPYKKSARIVGDVIGKYHPHGDTSVYDAKVRLAQPFSMRIPLVDGQGNFGSVDGDGAAAMRYTEARMHQVSSKHMFDDLDSKIIEYRPNYDGSEEEPSVLPIKFPNLIINGIQGIAVGMASSIPPHNPIEAMECVKYKVMNKINDKEDIIDELMEIMPSPDFPTGGYIHGASNMRSAWETGLAKLYLRAKWEEVEKNGKSYIHITELPYLVKKQELVNKIKDMIKVDPETKLSKIDGIQKIEDQSDRTGFLVVATLKPEFDAEIVMNELFAQTDLQKTYTYNSTVLVKKADSYLPETLGLNALFEEFISHRLDIIYKRTVLADKKLAEREHILEGLKKAIDPKNLDNVIKTIRNNKDQLAARIALMELLEVDEIQAEQVLQIRLARLTGLEIEKIDQELEEINLKRVYFNELINNEKARLNVIMEESEEMINEFYKLQTPDITHYTGLKHPFRTRLSDYQLDVIKSDLAALTKEEECNIILTANGFLRRVPMNELSTMNRGSRGKKQIKLNDTDCVQRSINCHSHDNLMFITNKGQCYIKAAYEIPDAEKGRHVNWILDLQDKENEKIIDVLSVNFNDEDSLISMFTKNGLIKLSKLADYSSATRKGGIKAIKLREEDSIVSAIVCDETEELFMVNKENKIIRFPVSAVSIVGRSSQGVKGMQLSDSNNVVGAGSIKSNEGYIVCVSEKGLIKISQASAYRTQTRGGKGSNIMKESERSGSLFDAFYVDDLSDKDVVFTTQKGFSNRKQLLEFSITGRNTSGVMLTKLESDDCLVDIFHAPHQDNEDDFEGEMEGEVELVQSEVDDVEDSIDD